MKLTPPTRQELDLLVRLSLSKHPLADELIIDKIKYWDALSDEQRHRNYCPDKDCCRRRKQDDRTKHSQFKALEIDSDDVNDLSFVVLRTEGYMPWVIIAFDYDWDFDEDEIKAGDNKKDFLAVTLPHYRHYELEKNIHETLDDCPSRRWFKYEDVVLVLESIPPDLEIARYIDNKRTFIDTLEMLEAVI